MNIEQMPHLKMPPAESGQVLIALALFLSLCSLGWGFLHMDWPAALGVLKASWENFRMFLCVVLALTLLGARLLRAGLLFAGILAITGLALLADALWPLLVILWFALSSTLLGEAVLPRPRSGITPVLSFLLGAGLYGTLTGLLAHFPVNYPALYAAGLAAPLLIRRGRALELVRQCHAQAAEKREWSISGLICLLSAIIYFSIALMPEVGIDALAVHLFIPAHMKLNHVWGFDASTYSWAVTPMLGDWLFSIVHMFGGESAARMFNAGMIFVIALLARDFALRAGAPAQSAPWASLLFLSAPLMCFEVGTLFIDSVWAAYLAAGVFLACRVMDGEAAGNPCLIPLAGVFLGLAAAAKAWTLVCVPVVLLFMAILARRWLTREHIRPLVSACLLFVVFGGIPYAQAWLFTGNPVFPFYNAVFKSPFYPPQNYLDTRWQAGISWDVAYRTLFNSNKYLEFRNVGAPGFQWLALGLPALAALCLRRMRLALIATGIAALSIIVTFETTAYLRYILPQLAILCACIAAALGNVHSARLGIALHIVMGLVLVCNFLFFKSAHHSDFSLAAILSPQGRKEYLENRLPIRNAVQVINSLNIHDRPVAVFARPYVAGLKADALSLSWHCPIFTNRIRLAQVPGAAARVLQARGVQYLLVDRSSPRYAHASGLASAVSDEITSMGAISVRRLKEMDEADPELLKNGEFLPDGGGWALAPGAEQLEPGGVKVSEPQPARQAVQVEPGRLYRNAVRAKCADGPAPGRIQINWHDSWDKFLHADIVVFTCLPEETDYAMEAAAPPNSATAIVYASSGDERPVIYTKNSLKEISK